MVLIGNTFCEIITDDLNRSFEDFSKDAVKPFISLETAYGVVSLRNLQFLYD